jgi:hypothetical protein
VGGVQPAASLLSSTLASSSSHPFLSSAVPAAQASETPATAVAPGSVPRPRLSGAAAKSMPTFTVSQVIAGLINSLSSQEGKAEETGVQFSLRGFPTDASKYDLRIAEDDGSVDADFPPVDYGVPITSVGVDKFVLCESATDKAVLRVCIPSQTVQFRMCEAEESPLELQLTCYPPVVPGSNTSRPIGFVATSPRSRPGPSSSPAAPSTSPDAGVDSLTSALASSSVGPSGITRVARESSSSSLSTKPFIVRLRGVAGTR